MFFWLNKQGVKSSEGFVVQSIDRFIIEYREGTNVIAANVERGLSDEGKACIYIHADEFNTWAGGLPISEENRDRILKNFKEAMQFQGIDVFM